VTSELTEVFASWDKTVDDRMKGWTSLSVRDDLKAAFREHVAKIITLDRLPWSDYMADLNPARDTKQLAKERKVARSATK